MATSDSSSFTIARLFGGAITASIPSTFIDASDLRQIPDEQEVFVDRNGLASITFDILEKADESNLKAATAIHLDEIIEGDAVEVVDLSGSNDKLESMRYVG
jgi:hypothetical protein